MKQLIYLAAVLTLAACNKQETTQTVAGGFTLSDAMAAMIRIDTVRLENISDEVTLSGAVHFNENSVVKVFSRSSGQVLEVPVSLGDYVHQGQTLAVVRSADVAGNYSDLASANADVAIARRQLDNAQSLYSNGLSSERELTEARQLYEKAVAARSKIQSLISINGGSKSSAAGQYVLTAPRNGYIVEQKVSSGSFIRSDAADNLLTISDLKQVWVDAQVYESDITKVKPGAAVEVRVPAYPERRFAGLVDKISQVMDPESKALRARIAIDNRELLLKPDMFARIVVRNVQAGQAVAIPSTALIRQDGNSYVVVYNSRNDLRIVQVSIAKDGGANTYITDGLQPGQRVVTRYQNLLFTALQQE